MKYRSGLNEASFSFHFQQIIILIILFNNFYFSTTSVNNCLGVKAVMADRLRSYTNAIAGRRQSGLTKNGHRLPSHGRYFNKYVRYDAMVRIKLN